MSVFLPINGSGQIARGQGGRDRHLLVRAAAAHIDTDVTLCAAVRSRTSCELGGEALTRHATHHAALARHHGVLAPGTHRPALDEWPRVVARPMLLCGQPLVRFDAA